MTEIKMTQKEIEEKLEAVNQLAAEVGVKIGMKPIGETNVVYIEEYAPVKIVAERVPLPKDTLVRGINGVCYHAAQELDRIGSNLFYENEKTSIANHGNHGRISLSLNKLSSCEIVKFPKIECEILERALVLIRKNSHLYPFIHHSSVNYQEICFSEARDQITAEYKNKYGHLNVRGW